MDVSASADIRTPGEALDYYRRVMVGNHRISVRGEAVTVRFEPEEIHAFTEALKPGRTPPPDRIVVRPGGRERRVFSLERARLMDQTLTVLAAPQRAFHSDDGNIQLVGSISRGQRLAVVVGKQPHGIWYVRTAFPLTEKSFVGLLQGRGSRGKLIPAPWPPK